MIAKYAGNLKRTGLTLIEKSNICTLSSLSGLGI